MIQQFILQVNTQRGLSGFALYGVDPSQQIDTSSMGAVASGTLTAGFSQQFTDPDGDTYTVTVSRP